VEECTYFWGVNTSWGINTAESKGLCIRKIIRLHNQQVGEVSGSDLKQISLDLSFTESQDVPYGSETSQSVDKCRMMLTLQKIPQPNGHATANKTQLSEWP
jgi:hypothetical protein